MYLNQFQVQRLENLVKEAKEMIGTEIKDKLDKLKEHDLQLRL